MNEHILIIGNHAAGISAADTIRKQNNTTEITILSREKQRGYYRPMLSEYLTDSHKEKHFYLHDEKWYEDKQIQLQLNTEIVEIDTSGNRAIDSTGKAYPYDKLILAMGSSNFIPPFEGNDLPGVFSLRTIEDADAIKAYAKEARKAIVIGGGLLGLEAAWQFLKMDMDVTVVEFLPRLIPKQLDEAASAFFKIGVLNTGINVLTSAGTSKIHGDKKVTGVELNDGTVLACDMVIISTGIRSNIQVPSAAGITVNRGVVVDDTMKTNIDNIYAAGDIAEFEGVTWGIWPVAIEQGKIAALNAMGIPTTYENTPPFTGYHGLNMNFISMGDIGLKKNLTYTSVDFTDEAKGVYKKLYFHEERLVGGILMGDVSKTLALKKGIASGASQKDIMDQIIPEY